LTFVPTQSRAFALVTPWPPQASGIADYAAELHAAMVAAGAKVDVFTNVDNVEGVTCIRSVDEARAELLRYRRVLFQVGNHPFYHGHMLPLIGSVGKSRCVIELHDLRLSHLLAGINYSSNLEFESGWLASNYSGAPQCVDNAHPVSDVLCSLASDVIVHSNYAGTRLRQLGVGNVHTVDLGYDLAGTKRPIPHGAGSAGPVRVGIFGTFQKNRQIPVIMSALARLRRHGIDGWKLVLGGRRSDDFDDILAAIEALEIGDRVELHEDLAPEDFLSIIKSVDVHVALRNPTHGETSGVVVQGLASGIPTIVSDVGWYSELPDFVAKIPVNGGSFELAKTLQRYLTDASFRDSISARTSAFATGAYNVRSRADEILSILCRE
jgi:glycosyltransferase involved in cell wall biosynthesis